MSAAEQIAVLPGCRICRKCGHARRYPNEFHVNKSYKDGRHTICAHFRNRNKQQSKAISGQISRERQLAREIEIERKNQKRVAERNAIAFEQLRANTKAALGRERSN